MIVYIAQKCSEYRKGDARTILEFMKNLFIKQLKANENLKTDEKEARTFQPEITSTEQ